MRLLRALDNKAFTQLTKVYTGTMCKLYQRDLKLFFEEAKTRVTSKKLNGNTTFHGLLHPLRNILRQTDQRLTFLANVSKSGAQKGDELISPAPLCLLGGEVWSPQGEGALLDSVLDRALSQLQPVCLAEQAFCVSFFQLDSVLSPIKVRKVSCFVRCYYGFYFLKQYYNRFERFVYFY